MNVAEKMPMEHKRRKKEPSTESESYELSESVSDVSSDSELEYEIRDCTETPEDAMLVLEQARLFNASSVASNLVLAKAVVSGDVVLAFCGFLPLERVLGTMSKRLRKTFNALIAASGADVDKSNVHVFYPERMGNVPLEMVLDLYRRLDVAGFRYIVFVSKVHPRSRGEEVTEEFGEYDAQDLEHMPSRGEEILLLSAHLSKKLTVVNGTSFRLFLLTARMFSAFVGLFESEIRGS